MVSELVSQRAFVTDAGTARFARRHADRRDASAFSQVAQLHLSSLGIGTYLGPPTDAADCRWMQVAIDEARTAEGHGDVPIGAVVVRDGELIARRHNERELTGDPTAHAEVLALREDRKSTRLNSSHT